MAYNSENAGNALRAETGAVYVKKGAPTAPITSGTATVPETFKELGYLTGDGISQSVSVDTDDRRAWQDGDILRTLRSNGYVEFTLSFAESSKDVLEFVYDSTQSAGGQITIDPGKTPARYELIIHILDRATGKIVRFWLPSAEVISHDDVTFSNEELVAYGVTIRCYKAIIEVEEEPVHFGPVERFDTEVEVEEEEDPEP